MVTREFTLGYHDIKKIMYEVKVNYSLFTIVQSSNLRDKLEEICVNMDKVMVALIDAVSMYPTIKLKKFNRAVR